MNNVLKVTFGLGLAVLLGTTTLFAQETAPVNKETKMAERKEMHEKKFTEASKRLNLTAEQQTKIKAILQQNKTEMKTLQEANKDKTPAEKRTLMITQLKKADAQITPLLDAKQLETYKQMKAEKRSEMQKKREERMKDKAEMDEYMGVF